MSWIKSMLSISALICLLFIILAQIGVIAQAPYPILISSVRTLDFAGNPQTTFTRGSIVMVEATLQAQFYGPSISYLMIVEIFDPSGYVAYIGFVTTDILPGQTKTTGIGYSILMNAEVGTYTVKVFVWNGWPSQMGGNWQALASPARTTFTVTG